MDSLDLFAVIILIDDALQINRLMYCFEPCLSTFVKHGTLPAEQWGSIAIDVVGRWGNIKVCQVYFC